MHGFLVLSYDENQVPAAERERLKMVGSQTLSSTSGCAVYEGPIASARLVELVAGHRTDRHVLALTATGYDETGALLDLDRFSYQDTPTLARAIPPFGVAITGPTSDAALVATDPCGLRDVYVTTGPGWAAASTSSAALAALTGKGLDVDAIGHYALVGAYHGAQTPFSGVQRLPAGTAINLANGVSTSTTFSADSRHFGRYETPRNALIEGARTVRRCVAAALSAFPDAALELSGGLDSRLLLAGIPPEERAGREAITLGTPDAPDWQLAVQIAESASLRHHLVDVSDVATLDPQQALDLVRVAARRRDYSANAIAGAFLDWVEERVGNGPRLSGQNGEFARGFYYAAQLDWPRPNDRLARTLAKWRILANDSVDSKLFVDGAYEEARSATLGRLAQTLTSYDGTWLQATDEYYLQQRMTRWVGAEWSASSLRRTILAPFFHPDYLSWARSSMPRWKRGSRLFCAVLNDLDPVLAGITSTGGEPPARLARPDIGTRLRRGQAWSDKAVTKVRQRIRHESKPPVGAGALVGLVREAWAKEPESLTAVANLPFLRHDVVEGIAQGRLPASAATVAFLVDLTGMLSASS